MHERVGVRVHERVGVRVHERVGVRVQERVCACVRAHHDGDLRRAVVVEHHRVEVTQRQHTQPVAEQQQEHRKGAFCRGDEDLGSGLT